MTPARGTGADQSGDVILGFDIGGTKSAVILGVQERPGEIGSLAPVDRIAFPTEADKGRQKSLERICAAADELLGRNAGRAARLSRLGVSCGGPLDSALGIVLSPTYLPGWDEVPIVQILRDRFGAPARLQNDANACALAEWIFGAGRGCRNLLFLTFGTGLGAGIILDGRLYIGTTDLAGGVGHIRLSDHGPVGYGKSGSFEGFCSGAGIAQLAQQMARERYQRAESVSYCRSEADLGKITTRDVAEAAARGDPLAREIFAICGRYLGQGLSILIDVLNPQAIILGSVFVRMRELIWPETEAALKREALPRARGACKVIPAGLGEQVGDYAALVAAVYDPTSPGPPHGATVVRTPAASIPSPAGTGARNSCCRRSRRDRRPR
jgi:glucokinase